MKELILVEGKPIIVSEVDYYTPDKIKFEKFDKTKEYLVHAGLHLANLDCKFAVLNSFNKDSGIINIIISKAFTPISCCVDVVKFTMSQQLSSKLFIGNDVKKNKLTNAEMVCSPMVAKICGIKGERIKCVDGTKHYVFYNFDDANFSKTGTKVLTADETMVLLNMCKDSAVSAKMAFDMLRNYDLYASKEYIYMLYEEIKKTNAIESVKAEVERIALSLTYYKAKPPVVKKRKLKYNTIEELIFNDNVIAKRVNNNIMIPNPQKLSVPYIIMISEWLGCERHELLTEFGKSLNLLQ